MCFSHLLPRLGDYYSKILFPALHLDVQSYTHFLSSLCPVVGINPQETASAATKDDSVLSQRFKNDVVTGKESSNSFPPGPIAQSGDVKSLEPFEVS